MLAGKGGRFLRSLILESRKDRSGFLTAIAILTGLFLLKNGRTNVYLEFLYNQELLIKSRRVTATEDQ